MEAYNHHFQLFDRSIHTKVTNSRLFVDQWLRPLICLHDEINKSQGDDTFPVVGFNVEIVDGAVAAIHLCHDDNCLIYHKPREESMPLSLSRVLSFPRCVFAGVGIDKPQRDILKREVNVSDSFYIPNLYQCLISFAKEILYYITPDLFVLTNTVLQNLHVLRPQPDGRLEQIEYASIRVYVSRNIGKLLQGVYMGRQLPRALFIKNIKVAGAMQEVYEVRAFDKTIVTTVTNRLTAVEDWIANIIDDRHLYDYVGFDLQLHTINNQLRIRAVQFCVDTRCLVIKFSLMNGRYLPNLEEFLVLDNNTFVGIDIQWKMNTLKDHLCFEHGGPLKVIDLGINAATTLERPDLRNASLDTLARELFGADFHETLALENNLDIRIDSSAAYEIANRLLPVL